MTFDLLKVRSSLLPYAFVWEKCWEFQMTSPLKPLGQCCSNFMWSLLRLGGTKDSEMVHWPRWLLCPYTVKTFKNLLLQNQISPRGQEVYQNCWNDGPMLTFDPFTAMSNLLPYAFVWALYIYMGKMLRILILDISSNPVESKLDDEHYSAYETQKGLNEPIENPRWPPQQPSWKSVFDISSHLDRFEPKLAL